MKVLGIFRGFPGLGRVVAGVSILETLRDTYGFKTLAISYLQGNEYLRTHDFKVYNEVCSFDYCSIGLLPTNHFAKSINEQVKDFCPSIIIVDGEPLIVQSLRISYPNTKIITLLNPSDVDNEHNDIEAMDFFNACYQLADLAIIHGSRFVETKRAYKHIISIPTILRNEITHIRRYPNKTIYCILGGGTLNVSSEFYESTVKIGSLCIGVAAYLQDYNFKILCSCEDIYNDLQKQIKPDNVILVPKIMEACDYYSNASLVITRSGRNTLGEVAYLGIPTISFISGCGYRKSEQKSNIESINAPNIHCVDVNISIETFSDIIENCIMSDNMTSTLIDGKQLAIDAILSLYRDNNGIDYYDSNKWKYELESAASLQNTTVKKKEFKRLRAAIFKENIRIVAESGYYNSYGKWISVNQENQYSELYRFEQSQVTAKINCNTIIQVVNVDSIDAGIDLLKDGYDPIVLDMACAEGPGGGVIGGCYGQEESLFRRSDLFSQTFQFAKYANVFGLRKSSRQYPLDDVHGAVYVRNSNIFRHTESLGYKLMERCYKLSFIAVPALKEPSLINGDFSKEDLNITQKKIRTIFRTALRHDHDAIVLGAWGCGIYKNPAKSIAKCFHTILDEAEFRGAFKQVVFAIKEDVCSFKSHNIDGNLFPFTQEFCK